MSAFRNPLFLFSISVCAALILPALFMDGMFMDGQIYACVGKNLAHGMGTFWDPFFSATYMSSYHEQPPLMFGMEAVFFRVLGDSLYTERIYSLVMAILALMSMYRIWKIISQKNEALKNLAWLPLLFFMICPVTFYAFINNVEEGTMVVFALLSVEMQLRGIYALKNSFIYFLAGGIFVFAASLCKGIQGLFPVIVPLTWWLIVRDRKFFIAVRDCFFVAIMPVVIYFVLLQHDAVKESYRHYFHDRLAATFLVSGAATTGNRFFLLWELFIDLLGPMLLGAIFIFVARPSRAHARTTIFFLITGLSGILPLMVTLEQRGFYLVTGLPFVIFSIALLAAPGAEKIAEKIQASRMKIILSAISLLVMIGTLASTFYFAGKPKRDAGMLHDVYLIGAKTGNEKTLSVSPEVFSTWSLQAYFVRYFNISLSKNEGSDYFLTKKNFHDSLSGYRKIPLATLKYDLYEKKSK